MNILLTNIEWDLEGQTREDCGLPENVLVVNVVAFNDDEISNALSDVFGFCHYGFVEKMLSKEHATTAGGGIFPKNLAVMFSPEHPIKQ